MLEYLRTGACDDVARLRGNVELGSDEFSGGLAKFRYVTWPGLTPTTFFLFITAMIGALQVFVEPQIMTGGQPYFSSTTTVMVIWQNAFRDLQMGYAATQAWLLGGITMLLTVINFTLSKRWVFYD